MHRIPTYFYSIVKLVSLSPIVADAQPSVEVMDFVEQLGGYFEASGLTRLAGRMMGWLLVCDPERQSSEQLAAALGASSGGISTNARMLVRFGYIERLAVAGDRRSYFRLRPHAFVAGERQRIRIFADLQNLADAGLRALRDTPPARGRRLQEMREVASYLEDALTGALDRFRDGQESPQADQEQQ